MIESPPHLPAIGSGDAADVREQLLSVHAVLVLSLVLVRCRSPKQIVHLATTAIPAIARCRPLGLFHPTRAGTYFSRAQAELAGQLSGAGPAGAALVLTGQAWSFAYPLASSGREDQPFLVVGAEGEPSDHERFCVSALAQICGVAISNAELLEAERVSAARLGDLNARLESSVSSLERAMGIHTRLNDVAAAQQGETGIARALFELTGRHVRIEDRYGNLRASAGEPASARAESCWSTGQRRAARALIARLRMERRPVHEAGTWYVLAEPRADVVGVIALEAPQTLPHENDLVALEYGATVLSIELARLQSAMEAELRMRRDLAEALLSGEDERATQDQAHALGYDLLRPHRAVIVSFDGRAHLDDTAFRLVNRHLKRLDIGSLVVGRSDGVVVLAHTDTNWDDFALRLTEECGAKRPLFAIGSRYERPADFARSFREAKFVAGLRKTMPREHVAAVVHFEKLGVYRILSTVGDLDEVERFMNEMLGPLIEYDRKRNADMVKTLARYLECGCNYDLTAEALHIHRSTFKYRLQRIRELIGYDLASGEVRFQLQFATKIWQTLQVLASPSASPAPRGDGSDVRRARRGLGSPPGGQLEGIVER
jgi:sugar diacid utilization regulator